ncbi:formate/nitrite transporter family protein [Amycolatopsis sp. GA6-003]|uniref:formate/nitrite transporter family protein n=1 Tax=Amycolatopsis sp. GA6-003 TaxID=2652444 RepID=UPI003916E76E
MTGGVGCALRRSRVPGFWLGFRWVGCGFGWPGFCSSLSRPGLRRAPGPGAALLASLVKAKTAESASALFFRGVLCNFLVCLAVWMAARTKSDGAKLALIFWCLLAFVSSGFEHVVANMTTFSLGLLDGVPGAFGRNLLFVGLGNLVGGGLLVGAAYARAGHPAPHRRSPGPGDGRTRDHRQLTRLFSPPEAPSAPASAA